VYVCRFLSFTWVAVFHAYGFFPYLFPFANKSEIEPTKTNFLFEVIWNGFFSVDTFFFIGGFLLALLTLKEMDKLNANGPATTYQWAHFWLLYYVHRYLR